MRLIDADRLMNVDFSECKDDSEIKAVIYAFPKAYDVDKVVAELEKNGQTMSESKAMRPYAIQCPSAHRYYNAISVKKAIEIVKQGGVENDTNT